MLFVIKQSKYNIECLFQILDSHGIYSLPKHKQNDIATIN